MTKRSKKPHILKTGERVKTTLPIRLHPAGLIPINIDKGEIGTVTLVRDVEAAVQFDSHMRVPPQYIDLDWLELTGNVKKNTHKRKARVKSVKGGAVVLDKKDKPVASYRKKRDGKGYKKVAKALAKSLNTKKNPDAYVIVLTTSMGKRLTYSHGRFTDNSKPNLYATMRDAEDRARFLIAANTKLRAYKITVEPATATERGAVFGARPRRNPRPKK